MQYLRTAKSCLAWPLATLQHCASARERSGATCYHSGMGEKMSGFCYFKTVTIVLSSAEPRIQQRCPCKIVSGGNCNANTALLVLVDHCMYLVHSSPQHQSLWKHARLQDGSPLFFAKGMFLKIRVQWSTGQQLFYRRVCILPGVRCSYSNKPLLLTAGFSPGP